jgi:hypothetical protein
VRADGQHPDGCLAGARVRALELSNYDARHCLLDCILAIGKSK